MKVNRSKFTYFLTCLLTLFCMVCASATAFAQGTNLGTIRGTVTDANGALVSGAKVQMTDLETNLSRGATTNKEGVYEVNGLKYGAYKVTVTAEGFKTATVNQVALRGGVTVRADVQLQVGGTAETVEVTDPQPSTSRRRRSAAS